MIHRRRTKACAFLAPLLAAAVFLVSTPNPARAQSSNPGPEVHHFNGKYLVKMGSDLGKVIISPVHWNGKDLLVFGGAAATTGLVMAFLDHGTREWVEDHQKTSFTNFSLFITHFGEAPVLIGLSAVLYAGGEAFKDDDLRKTALMSLESYCINGVIVTGMKLFFARARPLTGEGPSTFHWFSFKNNQHSFPSGHASSAFAVASVIAGQSDSFLVGAVSYGLASLVAISRVTNNEHWLSDVVAGSFLGYFIGKEVLALNRPSESDKPKLSFAPAVGGFSLSLRF